MTADDDLRRALRELKDMHGYAHETTWDECYVCGVIRAALAARSEPPDPEYHEHVAGDRHSHAYNGEHSHGGVSALRSESRAEGLTWYRRESDGHLLYGQLIGAADAARLAATPRAEGLTDAEFVAELRADGEHELADRVERVLAATPPAECGCACFGCRNMHEAPEQPE